VRGLRQGSTAPQSHSNALVSARLRRAAIVQIAGVLLVLMVICLGASGCNRAGAQRVSPPPAPSPQRQRIVSLAPNFTETLFALGLGDQVVGRTQFCRYPKEARRIEEVGPYGKPNIERVLALSPTLVIAESAQIAPHKATLESAGVRLLVIDCKRVALIPDMITQIGNATGVGDRARALARQWVARRDAVLARTKTVPASKRPLVMVDLWEDPLMVAGPGSFVDELIQMAGGRNVAFDAKKNWAGFSVEAVVNRKPDVIIRAFMGSDAENASATVRDWSAMPGLATVRVYTPDDIHPDLLLQPGIRTVDALEKLARLLHPNLFETKHSR
jgi:iron complex transport system substrate-binding protein